MRKFEIGVGQEFPVREGRRSHRHHHRGRHGGRRKLAALLLMALGLRRAQRAPERKTP